MKLPILSNSVSDIRRKAIGFGGINHSTDAVEGELSDSVNMSTRKFPFLTPRLARGKVYTYNAPSTIYVKDKLIVIDGTDFIYGGEVVGKVTPGEKLIVGIGNKIVVFPDKVYYDTEEENEILPGREYLTVKSKVSTYPDRIIITEALSEDERRLLTFKDIEVDGTEYKVVRCTYGSGDRTLWLEEPASEVIEAGIKIYPRKPLKPLELYFRVHQAPRYNYGFNKPYLYHNKFVYSGEDDGNWLINYKAGDCVKFSYTGNENFDKYAIIRNTGHNTLFFDDNTFDINPSSYENVANSTTITRDVPDFNVVCESNNRLWGCEGQTIYGSKLGDPTNFYVFDGLSTDSYSVAVGSEGEFTACTAYTSHILFFKENVVYKLYGTAPDNFMLSESRIAGIRGGSSKSLVTINDMLFYHARSGIYAYSGGIPQLISQKLGSKRFSQAVAGSDNERYYMSAFDGDRWCFYVFDIKNNLWSLEDDFRAVGFAVRDGVLCALSDDNTLYTIDGAPAEDVEWSATLTEFNEQICDGKGYLRLNLRLECEPGAWFEVFISEDGGMFRNVYTGHNKKGVVSVPVLPAICDSLKVKISGKGKCTIKALEREFQTLKR